MTDLTKEALRLSERLRKPGTVSNSPSHLRLETVAMVERLARRVAGLEGVLERINLVLTTVEGDNVPRGEAPKEHARYLARQALRQEEKDARDEEQEFLRASAEVFSEIVRQEESGDGED